MSFEDLESGKFVPRSRQSTRLPSSPLNPSSSGAAANAAVPARRLAPAAAAGKQEPETQAVSAGIFQISTNVNTFHRLVNALGTPKDTPDLRDKLHSTRAQILKLIKETTEKLKVASASDMSTDTSANKRIADAKLAKDFKSILQEFQKVQNLAAQRELQYTPFITQQSGYSPGAASAGSVQAPEQQALLAQTNRQELVLLENEIAFNEAIIEEREQGIKEIQQQIGEVNEIFKDLAVLVHEQGYTIEEISTNIENSAVAAGEAKKNLAEAAKTDKNNSSLVCLLLVIFGVVLLIIIIVLAT